MKCKIQRSHESEINMIALFKREMNAAAMIDITNSGRGLVVVVFFMICPVSHIT